VATDADDQDIPGIDRLLALTDGVVAIALTLLVLQLQVPVTQALKDNPDSARALWNALNVTGDGDELTSYLVSFLVIAQFWLVHHRILRSMRGHSEGLAWRNFGFLLALTLMPFTSDLIGRYGSNPVAITLFGLNLVAISVSTQWIYLYAAGHGLLIDEVRSAHDERAARVRVALTLAIVAISIALAWTDARLAKYVWLLFLVNPAVSERITRRVELRAVQAGRTRGADRGRHPVNGA
jgi:TMEM175 potassium channel family protein